MSNDDITLEWIADDEPEPWPPLPGGTAVFDSDGNLIARLGPPIPDGDEGAFKHFLIPVEEA